MRSSCDEMLCQQLLMETAGKWRLMVIAERDLGEGMKTGWELLAGLMTTGKPTQVSGVYSKNTLPPAAVVKRLSSRQDLKVD